MITVLAMSTKMTTRIEIKLHLFQTQENKKRLPENNRKFMKKIIGGGSELLKE